VRFSFLVEALVSVRRIIMMDGEVLTAAAVVLGAGAAGSAVAWTHFEDVGCWFGLVLSVWCELWWLVVLLSDCFGGGTLELPSGHSYIDFPRRSAHATATHPAGRTSRAA
jgi:hypothetical protein